MTLRVMVVCALAVVHCTTGAVPPQADVWPNSAELQQSTDAWISSAASLHQLLRAGAIRLPLVLVPDPAAQPHKRGGGHHYDSYPSRFRSQQYKVCRPSPDQIVEFLRALHLARSGKTHQLATLCSVRQSMADIDTNMRFVG